MKHQAIPPVIDALLRARGVVDNGWCKGFGSGDGKRCAMEALYQEAGPRELGRAIKLLAEALPSGANGVVAYNDAKGTAKVDVLALYDRAINLALKACS